MNVSYYEDMSLINMGGSILNSYVVKTPNGLVVVDSGYPGGFKAFVVKLKKYGLSLSDIRYIFITHAHNDHVGFLAELAEATIDSGARIILHAKTASRLKTGVNEADGYCPTRLTRMLFGIMATARHGNYDFPPLEVTDRYVIFDGSKQFFIEEGLDMEIIPLHGHTSDNIGLLLKGKALICGDAAMSCLPSVNRLPVLIHDIESFRESWRKIAAMKGVVLYPGHGKPFEAAELKKCYDSLDNEKLYPLKQKRI
ncbi:MAG: MBL fold metallo-hydrolase [Clostridiales bacterium]|nr:MBL fold metallo-hydrolase [Clostridiales bacterium]